MLQFVFGRSKSGKSRYIREYFSALAQRGNEKLLLIVPDQQTFDTEKALLNILGPTKVSQVTVVGFKRLCSLAFERNVYNCTNYADDSVKALLMSIALEETSLSLRVFGDKYDSPGYIRMMQKLRTEFIRDKVELASLTDINDRFDKMLTDKLHDTALVLSAFDAILESAFEDPDGELKVALELIRESEMFRGYTVAIDSFLSFSQLELDVIEVLMQQSEEMLISLSTDGLRNKEGIFAVSSDTESHLRKIAKNNSVLVSEPILCDYDGYFRSEELKFIEENVFGLYSSFDERITSRCDKEKLMIYQASDIYEECDFVSRNIRRLVMNEGYRYSDIVVITRDYDRYKLFLESTFRQYDIPNFMDAPVNVLSKPLIKMVLSAFDCVLTSFSKDSVLSLMKSGLLNLNEVEIADFENYLFTWGYSGSSLLNTFTANPRGFADEFTTDDLVELTYIDKIRSFVIEPLVSFRESLKDATVKEMCSALYDLLLSLGVREKLSELCEALLENSLTQLAQEQLRIWEVFVETLNRTVQVIGERKMKVKRLMELLKIQFMNLEIAFIPKSLDEVTVGDVERIRLSDKKIAFVMGAVEGEFPKTEDHSGIFTNAERQILTASGLLADATIELQYLKERYNCYYALTSASDKLFVSYPGATLTGGVNSPSEIIMELLSLFDNAKVVTSDSVESVDKLWSKKSSFNTFASRFGSSDELTHILSEYFESCDEFKAPVSVINRVHSSENHRIKEKDLVDKLYGKDIRISASQVESFYSCQFKYFCDYGLRLKERKAAKIDNLEYGTFVHFILEKFISSVTREEMSSLTHDEIVSKTEKIVDLYVKERLGGLEDKTSRFAYYVEKTKASALKLLKHLLSELAQSDFIPDAYELSIGNDVPPYTLTLDNGDRIIIRGKVDRADICEINGKRYLRIIDYKTGMKKFDLSDILSGLNLQMLIYLSALCREPSERYPFELIPAGVLYVPSTIPVINPKPTEKKSTIINHYLKALCMNGLVLDDEEVIRAMEKDGGGMYVPVKASADGLVGADSLASLEEFGAIFRRIENLITKMCRELKSGSVSAVPVIGNNHDSCAYCRYSSFCGYKEGDKVNRILKLDKEQILEELGLSEGQVKEE